MFFHGLSLRKGGKVSASNNVGHFLWAILEKKALFRRHSNWLTQIEVEYSNTEYVIVLSLQ